MFDTSWQSHIYSQNQQCNKYPYGELVSYVFRSLSLVRKKREAIRVLELGCGAGNNLWFLAELGLQVYGVDGSQAACDIAKKTLQARNQHAIITQVDFSQLHYADSFFDLIIDRESTCCATKKEIKHVWSEANRVLSLGGVVLSFMFNDNNYWLQYATDSPDKVVCLEENTYSGFDQGGFLDTGKIHFSTSQDIKEFFDFVKIVSLSEHQNSMIIGDAISGNYSEYIVMGIKE